jgi:two-component system, sporulation sensor kinase E
MVDFFTKAIKKINKLNAEQRKELLISAVEEINLLGNVLDSIDMGILVCDNKDNLVLANKSALRMIAMDYTEGIKLEEAILDDQFMETFKEIIANREKIIDKEIEIDQQEQRKIYSINVVPLVHNKKITGTLIYIEDITEKRRGEARLRRAENLASLTTLAAGVAHEIKNPLGSISIHLQLLQKALAKKTESSEKKTEKYFTVIKEEIDRLNRIVVDFLFAVRPMNLELREGDINELITQIMEFVQFEMKQSNIVCMLELDDKIPKILMDERYMKQALLNLIKNAQAAMPKGGVFTAATKFVDNEIRISLCDTGVGISKESLAKIFEPYFTTRETGTGLGLTQVYKIIREHQGEITVDSSPETGAEFRIILPVPQKDTKLIAYNGGKT